MPKYLLNIISSNVIDSIPYYLLVFGVVLIELLMRLLIPIVLSVVVYVLYKKNKLKNNVVKVFSVLLVLIVISSLFVGVCSNSRISVDSVPDIQQESHFIVGTDASEYEYKGKIFIYDNSALPDDFTDVFDDERLFYTGVSKIGECVWRSNIGFKHDIVDGYRITYSPVVLEKHSYFLYNYLGYVLIEDDNKTVFIPYSLCLYDRLYNNATCFDIYSGKNKISLDDILNNLVNSNEYEYQKYN